MKLYFDSPFLPARQLVYDSATGAEPQTPIPLHVKLDFESAIPDVQFGKPVESRLPFWLFVGGLAVLIFFAVK